jgi:2-keto-4-pentenoate hydratase
MDQTMLMSLLAARHGVALPTTPDGSVDPAALDSAALMQRLGQDKPQLAPLLQMMAAQKANAASRDQVMVDATAIEIDTVSDELAALAAQLEAAHSEVKLLRERCDTIAAALGACALCWGHEPACRACRGHGLPGRSLPDDALFIEYVMPAVRLVGASRQRSQKVAALATVTHGAPGTDATPTRVSNQKG